MSIHETVARHGASHAGLLQLVALREPAVLASVAADSRLEFGPRLLALKHLASSERAHAMQLVMFLDARYPAELSEEALRGLQRLKAIETAPAVAAFLRQLDPGETLYAAAAAVLRDLTAWLRDSHQYVEAMPTPPAGLRR